MATAKKKAAPKSGASDKAKKAESRRMSAQAASTKLGALSNKPRGKSASQSTQKQFYNAATQQERMYPGTEFRGFYTTKPGRADAKPSPKKQSVIKKK